MIWKRIKNRWVYAKLEANRLHPEPIEWQWIVYGLGMLFCVLLVIYAGIIMAVS